MLPNSCINKHLFSLTHTNTFSRLFYSFTLTEGLLAYKRLSQSNYMTLKSIHNARLCLLPHLKDVFGDTGFSPHSNEM